MIHVPQRVVALGMLVGKLSSSRMLQVGFSKLPPTEPLPAGA